MKETQQPIARIETVAEKQELKQPQIIGSRFLHPGHKCFELDLNTGIVSEAEFMQETASYSEKEAGRNTRKKVLLKENCLYATALNKANAIKKFTQMARKA